MPEVRDEQPVSFGDFLPERITVDEVPEAGATVFSSEIIAYAVLLLLAVLMRLLRLDTASLTPPEAIQAMAALGDARFVPLSAIHNTLQGWSLMLLGATEFAARLPTALAGIALTLSPLLFREQFGRSRTFAIALLLACSPVALAASRLGSLVIWESLFVVATLWSVWRYARLGRMGDGLTGCLAFAGLIFLASPTGYLHAAILALALWITLLITPIPEDGALPPLAWARQRLLAINGLLAIGGSVLLIFVVSTGVMTQPNGFDTVGQSLGAGLAGWFQPTPYSPAFTSIFSSLLYEGFYVLFALVGLWLLLNRNEMTFVDRFFVVWAAVAGLMALLYPATVADHALWLTLPLIGLASVMLESTMRDEQGSLWFSDGERQVSVLGYSVPSWARWMLATIAVFLFSLISLHARQLSLALFSVNAGTGSLWALITPSLLMLVVLATLMIFVGFTSASLYGGNVTLRGGGAGLVLVGLFASLGGGWQISDTRANDPLELWQPTASTPELFTLRETLTELTKRESGGFAYLPIAVVLPDFTNTDAALLAWALRGFENVELVNDVAAVRTREVILAPPAAEPPDLGGSYLGETFILQRDWNPNTLNFWQVGAWWFQRKTRVPGQPLQEVVLWVRQDVYNGVPFPGLP
ncbi:MAG: glycosyltransferase family 39 protein [Phototrophicaceae bacterium]|jgi:hypothetical protein